MLRFLLTASFALLLTDFSESLAKAEEAIDYDLQIKPLLKARCYACHGGIKREAKLRLDTVASIHLGGENGSSVSPNDALQSLLYQRVSSNDETTRMPPEGEPLSEKDRSLIQAWIDQGATVNGKDEADSDPRDHWSFKTIERPSVPETNANQWLVNPIDAFISEKHMELGLKPQPAADKAIWLRRVYLDLIGLPPTLSELQAFEADSSELAHEHVVDRLLESSQHGERWGRHWMDIWRYSDAWGLGDEVRNSQKHIWHWRDWIIESINDDKGYDQMLREMIAADEFYPSDLKRLRATGFLARQYFKFNRSTWMDETVEHTSKAILGLTTNCSKCHDHKYDPISQIDYYSFRAIFEPYQVRTEMVEGTSDLKQDGIPRAFDCNLEQPTYLQIRGDERNLDKSKSISPRIPEFFSGKPFQITKIDLPLEAYQPQLQESVQRNYISAAEANVTAKTADLETLSKKYAELVSSKNSENESIDTALINWELRLAEVSLESARLELSGIPLRIAADVAKYKNKLPSDSDELKSTLQAASTVERKLELSKAEEEVVRAEIQLKQAANDKKEESEKKLLTAKQSKQKAIVRLSSPSTDYRSLRGAEKSLESNLESEDSRTKPFPSQSSGRRAALANWLVSRQNPLVARVAVNHIWARHFGRPLVPTVFDFGLHGTLPSHQKLLDWLAVELIESEWSMKHIHRLIATSQTYRMSSSNKGASQTNLTIDPDNRYLWRMNSTRMESEIIRDSLIYLAGKLDSQIGGPSISVNDENSRRRSIYFIHSHNEHQKFLSMFDDANVLDCYRRGESIVPQQALALENSKLALDVSVEIANAIDINVKNDLEFIQTAFRQILATSPNPSETKLCIEILSQLSTTNESNSNTFSQSAKTALVHALLNHNDFITVR